MEKRADKKRIGKKKWLIIIGCVVLALVLLVTVPVSVVFNHYDIFREELSLVNSIFVRTVDKNNLELRIKYQFATGGYSVRLVPEDEGEYTGDGMGDYDGALGKYRMMVDFGDISMSTALCLKFVVCNSVFNRVMLKAFPVKILAKVASPSDHGFVLYLGFDQPISVEPVQGKLDTLGGTLIIPIRIDD